MAENKESNKEAEMIFKIFILGDSRVGKTACIERFCSNSFVETYITTLGTDKQVKRMPLENGRIGVVEIWDTAGQERYRAITRNMFRSADGIFLVYSVDCQESFKNVSVWMKDIENQAKLNIPILICGNKIDLPREVETKEGEELSKSYQVPFFETSCKNDINVQEAFKALIKEMFLKKKDKPTGGKSLTAKPKKKCC